MFFFVALLLPALWMIQQASCGWGVPTRIGSLEQTINESSGMAISRRIPNRSYRVNDSGDTGRFFSMDLDGQNTKSVNVEGFAPLDVEDLALGACDALADCIFIADIGDNNRVRSNLEIAVVEERVVFPVEVRPRHRVHIQYPDNPHDAESIGVHPDGSVYILTKDSPLSRIYRLKPDQWRNPQNIVQTLELVAAFDLAPLLPVSTIIDRFATAMDIARDGGRFIILTYRDAVEVFFDLSATIPNPNTWKNGQHYRQVELEVLEQQEAIAYLPDGKGFLYDTESSTPPTRPAPIMSVSCRK
jgi:hypothetical protein